MSPIKDALTPAKQNPVQRVGFFASLAIAATILFLHYPFEGYYIDDWVETRSFSAPSACGPGNFNNSDILNRCLRDGEMQIRPFSEWKSQTPIIEWLGSIVHVLIAVTFTLFMGVLWLWVFRTHDDG